MLELVPLMTLMMDKMMQLYLSVKFWILLQTNMGRRLLIFK